jgi:hypothetical protein
MGEYFSEIEITPQMIEAGVNALLRRGIGGDGPLSELRVAVEEAFQVMVNESCPPQTHGGR